MIFGSDSSSSDGTLEQVPLCSPYEHEFAYYDSHVKVSAPTRTQLTKLNNQLKQRTNSLNLFSSFHLATLTHQGLSMLRKLPPDDLGLMQPTLDGMYRRVSNDSRISGSTGKIVLLECRYRSTVFSER
jgi:hypothetical protein